MKIAEALGDISHDEWAWSDGVSEHAVISWRVGAVTCALDIDLFGPFLFHLSYYSIPSISRSWQSPWARAKRAARIAERLGEPLLEHSKGHRELDEHGHRKWWLRFRSLKDARFKATDECVKQMLETAGKLSGIVGEL